MDEPRHTSGGSHEKSDINIGKVALFGFLLLAIIGLAGLLIPWLLFERTAEPDGAASPPLYEAQKPPPPPRLQSDPMLDLKQLREAEEKQLHSYGWIDRDLGLVHVPIERAIELVARRGLPPKPQVAGGSVPAASGQPAPGKETR